MAKHTLTWRGDHKHFLTSKLFSQPGGSSVAVLQSKLIMSLTILNIKLFRICENESLRDLKKTELMDFL
jgi:hypothetical protein